MISHSDNNNNPKNINKILWCPKQEEWIKTIKEEIESMRVKPLGWEWVYDNNPENIVELPANRQAIGNLWILKIKIKIWWEY